jgi:hypothetical protein
LDRKAAYTLFTGSDGAKLIANDRRSTKWCAHSLTGFIAKYERADGAQAHA